MREGESGDCSEEKWDARVHQMCPLGVFGKRPNEHAFFWVEHGADATRQRTCNRWFTSGRLWRHKLISQRKSHHHSAGSCPEFDGWTLQSRFYTDFVQNRDLALYFQTEHQKERIVQISGDSSKTTIQNGKPSKSYSFCRNYAKKEWNRWLGVHKLLFVFLQLLLKRELLNPFQKLFFSPRGDQSTPKFKVHRLSRFDLGSLVRKFGVFHALQTCFRPDSVGNPDKLP